MTSAIDLLEFANRSPDAEEIAARSKQVVTEQISLLDPTVRLISTSHFNHSYLPDLVAEWDDRESRPVFIRNGMLDLDVESDVTALEERRGMILDLRKIDLPELSSTRRTARPRRSLLTDLSALSELQPAPNGSTQPLSKLARASLIQSGRGIFSENESSELAQALRESESGRDTASFNAVSEIASSLFDEGASYRIQRMSTILMAAAEEEPSTDSLAEIDGKLSITEARILLPKLLAPESSPSSADFWRAVGKTIDLDTLSQIPEIEGISIDALVEPNLPHWPAKRAQVTLNANWDQEADEVDNIRPEEEWRFENGILNFAINDWILHIATDARRLKGREPEGRLGAAWDDLRTAFSGLTLESVKLRGITRRIEVSAEESGDVKRDVDSLIQSVTDSYRIPEVRVRIPGSETAIPVSVDLPGMTCTAEGGLVPTAEIASIALAMLTTSSPVTARWSVIPTDLG